MKFEKWQDLIKERLSFYFPNGGEIKNFSETDEEFHTTIFDKYDGESILCSKKSLISFLEESLPSSATLGLTIEMTLRNTYQYDVEIEYSGKKLHYSILSFEFEQEENTSGFNCHLERYNKFDDFSETEASVIRNISLNVEEAFKKFAKYASVIERDVDFDYFLKNTPFEDRHRMEVELDRFMEIVENMYQSYLSGKRGSGYTTENVSDAMTEGLAYEGQSVGYKNPIYDAAYLYKLIQINEKAAFKEESARIEILDELKRGFDIAVKKTNEKQREELIKFGIL